MIVGLGVERLGRARAAGALLTLTHEPACRIEQVVLEARE
jgi:hypothetical protein